MKFLIVCIEFWPRFEPEICFTRFAINVLFIIVKIKRKVCLYVWNYFDFFPNWIPIHLTSNLPWNTDFHYTEMFFKYKIMIEVFNYTQITSN